MLADHVSIDIERPGAARGRRATVVLKQRGVMIKWAVTGAPLAAAAPAAAVAVKPQLTERGRLGSYSNYSADNSVGVSFLLLG